MNYGIGVTTFLCSVILLVKVNGVLSIFWDFPTFLFVVIGSLGLLLANKSISQIRAFNLDVRTYLVRSLERVGAVGAIIGFIQMLQNFSDPKSMGPGMAVCLLSVLYSQVLACTLMLSASEGRNSVSVSILAMSILSGSYFIIVCSMS